MKFKIVLLLIFSLITIPLLSQTSKSDSLKNAHISMILKYTNDFHSNNRISTAASIAFFSNYLIEMDILAYDWLSKDCINSNRNNISIFPLIDLGLFYLTGNGKWENDWTILPLTLTNSSHQLYLFGNPDYSDYNKHPGFNLSLFTKNCTNIYIIQKIYWIEIAPGAGIKLYYCPFALDIGFERKYQIVEKQRAKFEDGFFFTINFYIPYLE